MLFSLLLAFSLSLDALGIGLSYGLRRIRFRPFALLLLLSESFLLMTLFLWVGRQLASVFPASLAEQLSPLILLFFGAWLCLQALRQKEDASPLSAPSLCDRDASSQIEPKEALLLGFLLSVDSFAIGLSAAAGGMEVSLLPLFSALLQTAFLALGEGCGARLSLSPAPRESLWSLLSGAILLLLAALQLCGK